MKLSQNPFITSSEVNMEEDFFNREQLMKKIHEFVEHGNQKSFGIFGQRRMGKTSLLRKIERIYSTENRFCIYFNFQGKESDSVDELVDYLYKKITNQIAYPQKTKNISIREMLAFFSSDFSIKFPKKELLLLFDEFDEFSRNYASDSQEKYNDFVGVVAKFIQQATQQNWPIKFILSIGRNYKKNIRDEFWDIAKKGDVVEMEYFSQDIVNQLLAKSEKVLPFTHEAKLQVFEFTKGHPYFTQCLAFSAYSIAENEQLPHIDLLQVKKALEPAVSRYGSGIVWMWSALKPIDKIVLFLSAHLLEKEEKVKLRDIDNKLTENGFDVKPDKFKKIIDRLVQTGFLQETEPEQVKFVMEYFRKWVVLNVRKENIINELSRNIGL